MSTEIAVFLKFSSIHELTERQKAQVENKVLAWVRDNISEVKTLEVRSGCGSWWIEVVVTTSLAAAMWLGSVIAERKVNKVLDHIEGKANPMTEQEDVTEQSHQQTEGGRQVMEYPTQQSTPPLSALQAVAPRLVGLAHSVDMEYGEVVLKTSGDDGKKFVIGSKMNSGKTVGIYAEILNKDEDSSFFNLK